mgnify:FL=1
MVGPGGVGWCAAAVRVLLLLAGVGDGRADAGCGADGQTGGAIRGNGSARGHAGAGQADGRDDFGTKIGSLLVFSLEFDHAMANPNLMEALLNLFACLQCNAATQQDRPYLAVGVQSYIFQHL